MSSPNPQVAWAYVRTATLEADLEHQVTACRARAKVDGFTIPDVGVYADHGCSGATLLRRGLSDLLAAIERSGSGVRLYVTDAARLTRNHADHESLCRHFEKHRVVVRPLG